MVEYLFDRLAGLENVGEMEHRKPGHGGPGHQVDLGLGDHAQSPFGADHHAGEVEAVAGCGAGKGANRLSQELV